MAIKIDVEGHELNVLKGIQTLLKSNKCIIQIEIFEKNFSLVNSYLIERNFILVDQIKQRSNYFYYNYWKSGGSGKWDRTTDLRLMSLSPWTLEHTSRTITPVNALFPFCIYWIKLKNLSQETMSLTRIWSKYIYKKN